MLKLFDLNNEVRKTSMMFEKKLQWYGIKYFHFCYLWFTLTKTLLNVHCTDTWGPLTTRMLGAAELTAGQKTRTDSPCVRRVSLRRSLLKGLAEIPFMVSWLEGNDVMGKGATSDSTECSPEGTDEQGWFERMGRTKYVFQSTTQPIDPLLQQHSLPFPLTNFPLWFLYCIKLRYKYLLSSTCTIFCLPSSIFHGLGTDSSSQEKQSTSPHSSG